VTLELAVIVVALSAGSIVKGAIGMGLPMVALPILAAFLGVPHSVAIMSLPILFSNGWQVWRYRSHIGKGISFLPWLLVASMVGIVFGTWLLAALPERVLSLVLAVLVLAYIGLRLINPEFTLTLPVARRISPGVGFAAGTLQGSAGVSAPITITFMHSLRLPRDEYIGIISCIFLLPTLVQFPALWIADVLTWHRLLESVLALVPVVLLMPVGAWLARFLSHQAFDRIILAVLGIIAVELLVKGVGG
jgi:uncharacterized membrane protein YfcA